MDARAFDSIRTFFLSVTHSKLVAGGWKKRIFLSIFLLTSTAVGLVFWSIYQLISLAVGGVEKIGGLGVSNPDTSSFTTSWIGVLLILLSFVLFGVYLFKKGVFIPSKKVETKKVVESKKEEEKPKKKDGDYHFFPFGMLMSFHWIGLFSVFAVVSYSLYSLLRPSIIGGIEGFREEELRAWFYMLVAIPFLFHWINLVNGKKGPRPVAFAIGWFMTIAGIIATATLGYLYFLGQL